MHGEAARKTRRTTPHSRRLTAAASSLPRVSPARLHRPTPADTPAPVHTAVSSASPAPPHQPLSRKEDAASVCIRTLGWSPRRARHAWNTYRQTPVACSTTRRLLSRRGWRSRKDASFRPFRGPQGTPARDPEAGVPKGRSSCLASVPRGCRHCGFRGGLAAFRRSIFAGAGRCFSAVDSRSPPHAPTHPPAGLGQRLCGRLVELLGRLLGRSFTCGPVAAGPSRHRVLGRSCKHLGAASSFRVERRVGRGVGTRADSRSPACLGWIRMQRIQYWIRMDPYAADCLGDLLLYVCSCRFGVSASRRLGCETGNPRKQRRLFADSRK